MSSNDKFFLDLSAFRGKVMASADRAVRKIILDVGARLVLRSPVGDPAHWSHPAPKGYTGGRFRANWQYGEGAARSGTLDVTDKGGGLTIQRLAGSVVGRPAGKVHFITNNLPYAMELERGHSKQAPQGMVALTVREFQSVVARAAKEVKG